AHQPPPQGAQGAGGDRAAHPLQLRARRDRSQPPRRDQGVGLRSERGRGGGGGLQRQRGDRARDAAGGGELVPHGAERAAHGAAAIGGADAEDDQRQGVL